MQVQIDTLLLGHKWARYAIFIVSRIPIELYHYIHYTTTLIKLINKNRILPMNDWVHCYITNNYFGTNRV